MAITTGSHKRDGVYNLRDKQYSLHDASWNTYSD